MRRVSSKNEDVKKTIVICGRKKNVPKYFRNIASKIFGELQVPLYICMLSVYSTKDF